MSRRLCLVTGASAGIGAAFAGLYASHGHDLCLTARRRDRLEALAADLRSRFDAEVIVADADLARPDGVDQVLAAVAARGRQVDALVNNAGYGVNGDYAATGWRDQRDFLQVLTVAVAEMTHKVLPGMVERRFGRIVNVASVAGLLPASPGYALYSAAKSLVVRFSCGLHVETRGTGVHVTALCPGLTETEFHDVADIRSQVARAPGWVWSTAEAVARAGYDAVEADRAICVPGWPNKLAVGLAKLVPDPWLLAAAGGGRPKSREV